MVGDCEKRITNAKIVAIRHYPFFGYLLLHLQTKTLVPVGTACVTDDGVMYYNPEWVETLNDEELLGLVCHEVSHLALGHLTKHLQCENHEILGIAHDIVINNLLLENSLSLPKCGYLPKNNECHVPFAGITITNISEKCSEQIYYELLKTEKQLNQQNIMSLPCPHSTPKKEGETPENCNGGKGGIPGVICKDCLKKIQDAMSEGRFDTHIATNNQKGQGENNKDWGQLLIEAAVTAKQRGLLPAGIERLVNKITKPKINWRSIITKKIVDSIPNDFTWRRLNKKSISIQTPLPGTLKENIELTVSVDTSGSISETDLSEFLSEITGIANAYPQVKMTCIAADAEVHEALEVKNGNIQKIRSWKPKGGGGTAHQPVLEYIKKKIPACKLAIFFTDGYSDIETLTPPGHDVIWAINKGGTTEGIKFGKIIRIE